MSNKEEENFFYYNSYFPNCHSKEINAYNLFKNFVEINNKKKKRETRF